MHIWTQESNVGIDWNRGTYRTSLRASAGRKLLGLILPIGILTALCFADDWPQYRGPTTDGISPDPISINWPSKGPIVVWTNMSLTNGFSTFAVSQGRAFVLISNGTIALI